MTTVSKAVWLPKDEGRDTKHVFSSAPWTLIEYSNKRLLERNQDRGGSGTSNVPNNEGPTLISLKVGTVEHLL